MLSCLLCLHLFFFPHTLYVSDSSEWKRRLPEAFTSFPPITTNVTPLFSFMPPLSFYLSFPALSAPLSACPLVCLSLTVPLSFCPWAEQQRVKYGDCSSTPVTHPSCTQTCLLIRHTGNYPNGPILNLKKQLCAAEEFNVSITYQL